jgi:hypothetical protein
MSVFTRAFATATSLAGSAEIIEEYASSGNTPLALSPAELDWVRSKPPQLSAASLLFGKVYQAFQGT